MHTHTQGIALAKPVFNVEALVAKATAEPQPQTKVPTRFREQDLRHADALEPSAPELIGLLTPGACAAPLAQDGVPMWGFTVLSDDGGRATLYTDDAALRDTWVRTINLAALARREPQLLPLRCAPAGTHQLALGPQKGALGSHLLARDGSTRCQAQHTLLPEAWGGWQVSLPQCLTLGPPQATQGGWGQPLPGVSPHRPYGRWGRWGCQCAV